MSTPTSEKLERARATIKNLRHKGEKALVQVMHTAESSATAFALGAYEGYHGEEQSKIGGTDAGVVVGILSHLAALSGAGSESLDSHFAAIGDGAFSVAAYKYGRNKGDGWRKEKDSKGSVGELEGVSRALNSAEAAASRLSAQPELARSYGLSAVGLVGRTNQGTEGKEPCLNTT